LSQEKVTKYFEVRLLSLAVIAVLLFFLFVFFFFFFLWQGQYAYSAVMVAVAVIVLLAAFRLWQYGKMLRKGPEQQRNTNSEGAMCAGCLWKSMVLVLPLLLLPGLSR
jgi:membrane protease YdiL (CAAX protease family)